MQKLISKYEVLAQLWSCDVWKDRDRSERVKRQESIHTAGGSV